MQSFLGQNFGLIFGLNFVNLQSKLCIPLKFYEELWITLVTTKYTHKTFLNFVIFHSVSVSVSVSYYEVDVKTLYRKNSYYKVDVETFRPQDQNLGTRV